jgi:hypothetical protein
MSSSLNTDVCGTESPLCRGNETVTFASILDTLPKLKSANGSLPGFFLRAARINSGRLSDDEGLAGGTSLVPGFRRRCPGVNDE